MSGFARWLGHPRGLWTLAATEFWERVSFAGMQAMLILYMTGGLLDPERAASVAGLGAFRHAVEAMTGPLSATAFATQTFGLYIALITLFPLLGGLIGDRWIGRRAAVTAGALLMTAGHLSLAFDRTFLVALVLLILGAGFLRGNLTAQLKSLYADGDRREQDAFQLYNIGVELGSFVAPLLCGTVGAMWGWHAGFASAGLGMLAGLAVYLAGRRHLPSERPARERREAGERIALTGQQRRDLLGLVALFPLGTCFWIAQSQVWNVYKLWLRDHVDLIVGGHAVPVPWLSSLDGLAPAALAAAMILIWHRQAERGREPDMLTKMGVGALIFALGVAILAGGSAMAGAGKVPLAVPLAFHLVSNLGWVWFAPTKTALYAARSPGVWRGTMLGVNQLSVSAASLISGRMGGWYEHVDPATYWLANAAIVGTAGVLILIIAPALRRLFGADGAVS